MQRHGHLYQRAVPRRQGKLHRQLARPELESFFVAADQAVRLANPDRVIKAVDGDYDPPRAGPARQPLLLRLVQRPRRGTRQAAQRLLAAGQARLALRLRRVWRRRARSGDVMRGAIRHVAAADAASKNALVARPDHQGADGPIPLYVVRHAAHAGRWVAASQAHQAWATRLMTEAFRRDSRMNSFAIHLFVDAFPAGWMKAIMD